MLDLGLLGSSAFSTGLGISVLGFASSGLVRLLRSALALLCNGRDRRRNLMALLSLSPKTSDSVTESGDGDSYIGLVSWLYRFGKQEEKSIRDWIGISGQIVHGTQQAGDDRWVMHNKGGVYSSGEVHKQMKHVCVDRSIHL